MNPTKAMHHILLSEIGLKEIQNKNFAVDVKLFM
jgi:hypothetical protein